MKMQLVTKRGLFATLKAVLTVMFIYFTFGYVLGYMNSPITIYELDTKQQSKFEDILTSHGITYKGEIEEISYQSILKNQFFCIKLNTTNMLEFKKNNPNIVCYKFGGNLWCFPAGFHAPYAKEGFSCYYFFDKFYISVPLDTLIGNDLNDLFWEIYAGKDNSVNYYIPFYVLFIIYLFCMICLEKVEKKHKVKNKRD